MLSQRLGVPPLPVTRPADQDPQQDDWVATDPAGVFTEPLFRKAETVVWLHFSPLPYLADWLAHRWEQMKALSDAEHRAAVRSRWGDVLTAFGHLLRTQDMYELFHHPALAHVRLVELRSPREAEFWLLTQRRRKSD
jgi:hypothetical protein